MSELRDSPGYVSLRHEMRVRSILEQRGWRATHGPYYTDFHERVPRELDVSATRVWTSKKDVRAHVTLLVECKNFKKPAAQLLAGQRNVRTRDRLYAHWFGLDDRSLRLAIREALEDAKFDVDEAMTRLESILYPDGESIVTKLLADAPKAKYRASATREPDREDSGATWNAAQQVFAALNGTAEEMAGDELEEFRDGLDERAAAEDRIEHAATVLRMIASDVYLFHPVISIDAPLMLVSQLGKLTNVPWCRVERARVLGAERQWIDVVNADAFEDYAATLTAWYERVFSAK